MKFVPLHDRVLVKRDEVEKVTDSGIFIPGAGEKPCQGTVIAAGPGKQVGNKFIETSVKPDDIVVFGKNAGHSVKLDDEEFSMMTEDEIYGIIKQ